MSETCPIIIIEGQNGQALIINECDYNKAKHTVFGKEKDSFSRKSLTDFLDKKEVKYAKNISDKKLKQLVDETKAASLSVVEKDGKFIIVNGEGIQTGEEVYTSLEDAETMVTLLMGK